MAKQKIALVCGGPSSEHEVSLKSTAAILKNINSDKYEIFVFYLDKQLNSCFFEVKAGQDLVIPQDRSLYLPFLDGIQKNLTQCDKAVLMGIHGEFVEDGRLQNILDFFGIKYTGSGMEASVLAMDKYDSMNLAEKLVGIKMPKTIIFNSQNPVDLSGFEFPLVLKPNNAGSSVGVRIIKSKNELEQALEQIKTEFKFDYWLIQEYITNALEISCGCLEKTNGEFIQLPPIEIIPKVSSFFDYSAKYQVGGSKEITPPQSISKELSDRVSKLACQIHQVLRCKTYSRSDFLVQGEQVVYLETNTLPGMTQTSLLPQEAKAAGISFSELIDFVIEN
ncbi:MAG: ATP-grasp domain-containing protein [Patescibacteria group bacterium]